MIYRCPNCGNVLEYDVKTGYLTCSSCGTHYEVPNATASETETTTFYENVSKQADTIAASNTDDGLMEVKLYHCSSCGADIMVSDTEISTFCSFCGLPSIIFDRVSKEKKPEKIIPFKLTKQDALSKIKERFEHNSYVSDEIKEISVDKIYGIYIPYWLYMTEVERHFAMNICRNGSKDSEKISFDGKELLSILLDASENLPDELSKRLDPFPLSEMVNFNTGYLSGFHAERYDVSKTVRNSEANAEARKIIDYKLISNYCKKDNKNPDLLYREDGKYPDAYDKYESKMIMSALVPIYFVTIRHQHRVLLILVNGTTGKVVTNVPPDEGKVKKKKIQHSIIASVIYTVFFVLFCSLKPEYFGLWMLILIPIVILRITITSGNKARALYKNRGHNIVMAQDSMMSRDRGNR